MKVVENRPDRIMLEGIPGAGFALMGGLVVCPVLAGGAGFFLWQETAKVGASWWNADVLVLLGCCVFIAAMWGFCLSMFFRRERLVLDKVTKRGEHTTRWLWSGSGKRLEFDLDRIHSVSLEFFKSSGGGRSMPKDHKRCRLRLEKPRRAIEIESSENGFSRRVEPVADELAAWIGINVTRVGNPDD